MLQLEEIFCYLDDFCKIFENIIKAKSLPNSKQKRGKKPGLCLSEIMTILIMFHLGNHKNFKRYYLEIVCEKHKKDFPGLVRYSTFVSLIKHAVVPLFIFAKAMRGEETEKYYVDSTKLPICDNLRIHSNKVFKDMAERGKTSTGWFFGFKLHLVINENGEIMNFTLTRGNKSDLSVVPQLVDGLKGWLFGDRGYISSKLAKNLEKNGLELITKLKKNMKKRFLDPIKKYFLDKRGIVETVIGHLKRIMHIDHTRHRSPKNFLAHTFASIAAYAMKPNKPRINLTKRISEVTDEFFENLSAIGEAQIPT